MPVWQKPIKRGLDIALSGLGLVVLAVPLGLIGLAIKLDSRGPILFRHPRVGRDGEIFVPLKFRTMVEGAMDQGLGTTVSESLGSAAF